jgi:hypothetical protein
VRVFALTDLGKKVTSRDTEGGEEMRVLHYIRENETVTDDELELVGGRWMVRNLKKRGLIKELTQ